MRGETITLIRYERTGDKDPSGTDIGRPVEEQIDDVLVSPAGQSNATDAGRPDGVTVAYDLCFPRAWQYKPLKDAVALIDGHPYEVVGDPRPLHGGMRPTRWNMTVRVTDTRG